MLMTQINELLPGHRNRGPMTGFNKTDKKSTTPSPVIISDAMKNGRRAGNTDLRKIFSPESAA
jgi:hypothetical protein